MSWNFDGTSGWVGSATVSPVANNSTGVTLACWARATALGNTLINLSDATGNSGGLRLIQTGTGTRGTSIASGNVASIVDTTTGSPTINTWGHYCAVFTTAARSAYYNGANKATTTATSVASGFTRTQIGARRAGSVTDAFFNGRLAEVGVWNVVLTDDEVLSLADGAACSLVRPQSLVLYAPMIRNLADYSRTLFSFSTINTGAAVDTLGVHPRIYM